MDQTTALRKLSGEKRLAQALRLSDFVRELSRKGREDAQTKSPWQKRHTRRS